MNLFDLKGQTAVVTGASSGLGKRFAIVLAEHGANVAILARRFDRLETLAKEIESKGVKCLPIKCDVLEEQNIIDAVAEIEKKFGHIDILVNNAGVSSGSKPTVDLSSEDFDWVMNVDLRGVFLMARECAKNMIKNNYGRIINIASMLGLVGNTFFAVPAYHASKGAVVNLSRGLAAEWAKNGITVNSICPGYFESEMTSGAFEIDAFRNYVKFSTPMEREGREEELDTVLLFLAARASSYVTGQNIAVDGGWTAI